MGEPIKLSEIEIRSFRGIRNYKLETNNNSLVFCGANGTGKSSFVNAFEFLFTGIVKSLKGIGEVNHDKSIIHMGDRKDDVLVKAKVNRAYVTRTLKNGLVYDEKLEDLIDDFKNGSFILNRQRLLNFINAQPKKRWEEAANLINFNEYDETEKAFEGCFKSFKNQLKVKKEELDENTEKIEEHWKIDDVYDNVNEILVKNKMGEIDESTNLDEILKDHSIRDNDLDGIDVSAINEKYQTQLNIYERIALEELKSSNDLLSILTSSKRYIMEKNSDICPVCRNKIDSDEVLAYLSEKTEELKDQNSRLVNWKHENSRLLAQIRDLNNRLTNFDLSDLIDDLEMLSRLEITPSQMDRKILKDIESELDAIDSDAKNLNEAFDVIILLSERKSKIEEIEKLERQLEVSKIALDLFSEKKKEAIEMQFETIGDHITEYYNFIHEDDDLISPKVRAKNSKGLLLSLIFGDKEEDPRSYASEGHLDSLGLCIFLAFAKIYNRHNFLILDDIISTVDLEHKEMVIKLLFEKFSDYTFIITTHNKLWYEQLQRLANSNNIRHRFTFMEILDWDKTEGPVMSKNPSSKKRIEEYLKVNDTFAAGNAIRRHLEFVLGDLAKMNKIPLPIEKHYSVGDYFKPVKDYFLEDVFKDTDVEDYYKKVFKQLEDTTYIGNLLSHKNEENYDLTRGEIEKFKLAVYDLENAFKCRTHNKQYFKIDKKRKIGICNNEKCTDLFRYAKNKN